MNHYETHQWKDPQLPFIFRQVTRKGAGHEGEMNWHENVEIIHAVSGTGYLMNDGVRIPMCAGDTAAISPHALHDMHSDGGVTYWYLIVDRSFCQSNYFDTNRIRFRQEATRDPYLDDCFARLIAAYGAPEDTPYRTQEIRATVLLTVAWLCRCYGEPAEWHEEPFALSAVKLAIGTIRAELSSAALSPSWLAERVGLSHSYFAHRFRQITGLTCAGYINLMRCERAKELLAEGRLEIGEIARLCGFSGASYFTRVFRAEVGMSPGAYRARCSGEN